MSHERKLKSYAAEAAFYSTYSSRVLSSGGAAVIAEALLVDVSAPTHFLFVLTDLRVNYPQHRYSLDKQVRAATTHRAWIGRVVPTCVCSCKRVCRRALHALPATSSHGNIPVSTV